jgi:16S rRNA (cytosine967-C5)-methyltransferase
MIAPARLAAYEVLRAVNGGRADLPHALARARSGLDDERDRALAGEIATGTLRWQGAFDHVIEQFARRPVTRLDPEVLDVLRLTAFQLLHLDRIPASAAVNDAVNLTRRAGKKSAAPLVNAVLRRLSRERRHLPSPPRPEFHGWHLSGKGASRKIAETVETTAEKGEHDSYDAAKGAAKGASRKTGKGASRESGVEAAVAYLTVTLSHPKWLVQRWLERYGFEKTEAWAQFDNAPAALTLRVNRLRTTPDDVIAALAEHGVHAEPTRFAPDGLVVRDGNPLLTPLAGEGLFFVQDEASQLIALFADPQPDERVLDLCASPGGKTTAMAAAMRDRGVIVAGDVRPRRMELLARAVAASGATSIRLVQADAARALPFQTSFARVLLDAPCSGLGTLRRDPDIRWRRTEADLSPFADAQLQMLECAAAAVRQEDGRLIYSTCSSEPEENEEVVSRFLERHPEFRPADAPELPQAVQRFLTPDGHLRTLPFRDQLEAFFAAMLVKTKDLR